jgi:signal peptidase II
MRSKLLHPTPTGWKSSGLVWLWVSLLVIGLDQFTKQWALASLVPYEPVAIMPMFNIMLAFNPGAAFSFLGDQDGWQRWFFIALAWGVSLALVVWLSKTHLSQRRLVLGLTLVLGGAIGNVIDRMVYHHVVDFLDFYWGVWHYPTFNVADIAISVGAVLLIWDAWKSDKA